MLADTVSEVQSIKHAFDAGVKVQAEVGVKAGQTRLPHNLIIS
jgi:hypothetical protein